MGQGKFIAESDWCYFQIDVLQAGNPKRTHVSKKYAALVKRREVLMEQFQKQMITRKFYLQQMGALSLKADRAAKRVTEENNDETVNVEEVASDDSLSETRPLPAASASSESDEGVDPPPAVGDLADHPLAAALGIGRRRADAAAKKKSSQANKKQLCPVCKRGFQLRRVPPLHITCAACKALVHKRCLKVSSTTICDSCNPSLPPASPSNPLPLSSPSNPPPPLASTSHHVYPSPPLQASILSQAGQSNRCDEAQQEDELPGSCLATYQGSEKKFDERMATLGFKRSPSQPDTRGDGNCGLYALLDQLNLPVNGPLPMFERGEALFAR